MRARSATPRGRLLTLSLTLATALVFVPGVTRASGVEVVHVECPDGTLQEAIDGSSAGSTIVVSGTCVENLVIDHDLTIRGLDAAALDGAESGWVLRTRPGVALTIEDIEVRNGKAHRGGGVLIAVGGHLIGRNVIIAHNEAVYGGGISARGASVTLVDAKVMYNNAAVAGGGIELRNEAELVAIGSVIEGNGARANGGGILANDSTVALTESDVYLNTAKDGGGIANTAEATSTLVETRIRANTAGRYGGGIFNAGSDVWITRSAVTLNEAALGGGVSNIRGTENARVFVTNSTVALNRAEVGSAIYNNDVFASLDHVTITDNEGSPAFFESRPPPWTVVVNSIIAENPGGDCSSSLLSGGGNVVGDCAFRDEDGNPAATSTDIVGVDPLLQAIGNATVRKYYEPRPHSPAIDLIPVADCTQSIDQRGGVRPQGAGCEPGSIEFRVDPSEPTIDADFEFGHQFTSNDVRLSGWASDDEAVVKVAMGVKDRTAGLWLQDDLVTWGAWNTFLADMSAPGETFTEWWKELHLAAGQYSLMARAVDPNLRDGQIVPYRHFTVATDLAAPVPDADFAAGAEFTSPARLTGSAVDDVAVSAVRVAIRDRASKNWLQADMASWAPTYHAFTPSTDGLGTPAATWSFSIELPDGRYNLALRARDEVGNWARLTPYRPFSVSGHVPPLFTDSGQRLGESQTLRVAVADLDEDTDLDAYAANGIDSPNLVWLNDGDGEFVDSGQRLGASWSWGVDLGDVDGDGDADAFVANYAYGQPNTVWFNDGDGEFVDSGQRLGDSWSLGIALGRLDGDDTIDAFVANYQPSRVWLNRGDGIFRDQGVDVGPTTSASIALADLDADGDLDAVLANHGWTTPAPNHVLFNDGSGGFTDSGQSLGDAMSVAVALADLDGDGDLDMFVSNNEPNEVWFNDGFGHFTDSGQRLGGTATAAVGLGDIDGDGDVDAFAANRGPDTVWLNDGAGHFVDAGWRLSGANAVDVALIDLDGDGDLDAWLGIDGPNEVWINTAR